MENLDKEWFDSIPAPLTLQEFKRFIDWYKKETDWNKLFNSNSDYQDMNGKNAPSPKYHDIPFEMQIGVVMTFLFNMYGEFPPFPCCIRHAKELIEGCFIDIESQAKKQKVKNKNDINVN